MFHNLSYIYSSTARRAYSPYFSQCSVFYSLCAFVTPATNSHLKFVVHQNVLLNKSAAHKTQKQQKKRNEEQGMELKEVRNRREEKKKKKRRGEVERGIHLDKPFVQRLQLIGSSQDRKVAHLHKTEDNFKEPRNTFPFTTNRSGNVRKNHIYKY